MKMKLRTQLLAGNTPILVLMIIIVVFMHKSIENRLDTQRWVEHTHEVIAEANLVTKLLVDMETGQPGFLITGKDEFLETYDDAIKQYETTLTNIKKFVSDNPAQVKRLDETNTHVKNWLEVAAYPEIAESRKVSAEAVDADHLQAVLARGVGKGILDNMRTIMDVMIRRFEIDRNVKAEYLTESIAKAMVEQETGQRGFLITGEEEFLEPYRDGKTHLDEAVSELMALIDNAHDRKGTVKDLDDPLIDSTEQVSVLTEVAARGSMGKPVGVATVIKDIN